MESGVGEVSGMRGAPSPNSQPKVSQCSDHGSMSRDTRHVTSTQRTCTPCRLTTMGWSAVACETDMCTAKADVPTLAAQKNDRVGPLIANDAVLPLSVLLGYPNILESVCWELSLGCFGVTMMMVALTTTTQSIGASICKSINQSSHWIRWSTHLFFQ